MVRTGAIKAKVHAPKSRWNFCLRTHSIHTIGPWTHVLLHFIIFGCISGRFVAALNSVQMGQSGAINANVCATKSSELLTTNAPDPHHWTLNSCFSVFRNVWVPLGPFRYCTELGAKWAELVQLMQKFMPRSRVGTFRYERTRNTPWDPKLKFCCIS